QELYNQPANKFVASFIGSPAMNFFDVKVGKDKLTNDHGLELALPEGQAKVLEAKGYLGKTVTFGIRPEDISSDNIAQTAYPNSSVEAEV
ncbi:sugar ABC transporter ATP-binding protein, partial [Streptococcus suis]